MSTASKKIIAGLKDAVRYTRCNHMWLFVGYTTGNATTWRCNECGCIKTEFK